MKIRKNIQPKYQGNVAKKNILTNYCLEKEKKYYFLIKDFNRFMYHHSLHRGRKHFCRYCLHFTSEEILSVILKIAVKLMVNKRYVKLC